MTTAVICLRREMVTDDRNWYLSDIDFSGTSSVAVAWSGTFDELIGGHILDFFKAKIPINANGLAPYPDFFAVGLILILSGSITQCFPLTSLRGVYSQPAVSNVLCLPTKECWRSESKSQRQSTRSSQQSTSWCCCSWPSLVSSRATSETGRSVKRSWGMRRNEILKHLHTGLRQLQDFPYLLSHFASADTPIPPEHIKGERVDSSRMVLLGPWPELQPAFTLLSDLTALPQQVQQQNLHQ